MSRLQAYVAILLFLSFHSVVVPHLFATELATLTGYVTDPAGLRIPQSHIQVTNIETNISYAGETNDAGFYRVSALPTGNYRVIVQKTGFKTIVKQAIELHVQDVVALNFQMELGSVAESVTVESGAPLIDTESAAISTVVDRRFAENLPLNGRSFQALIQLTPGVVLTPSSSLDGGQFSVNGQRASSNYWLVDGVSGNVGIGVNVQPGNGLAGTLGTTSVLGGTNSLVSVDALQEFRIQTSTFAPEFGRTPGAQISIATRSGTNSFHGTIFDYLRNDALDANDWFANYTGQRKPKERQNDFGGTFSGPIFKDRTFFFFSYEGLRLRLPQTVLSNVPDLAARRNAIPAMQPFLNAYPQPNGVDNPVTGVAQFNSSFSNPATLDASSLRLDHKLTDKWLLFARYNYSPSQLSQRGANAALSVVQPSTITTQTATAGATWNVSSRLVNELRFNYSSTDSSGSANIDGFGGATPISSLLFPSPFTERSARLSLLVSSLGVTGFLLDGEGAHNKQKQINVTDAVSFQSRSHGLKFGFDFRRLAPILQSFSYFQQASFNTISLAGAGNASFAFLQSSANSTLLFRNFGAFAQDTWRITPRLTLTYGIRWDIDAAPTALNGPNLNSVTGFNLGDLSNLALAPQGTAPYSTKYGDLAPRMGIAYQLIEKQDWQTMLRGGFGVFYDLASAEAGNAAIPGTAYPFGGSTTISNTTFPLSSAAATPPPIVPPTATAGTLYALDPSLELPYTLQWNVSVEQGLWKQQALSASYIGSRGRRLIQSENILSPNSRYQAAQLVTNAGTSDYDAMQVQFRRRLAQHFQVLASYAWAHSLDTGSASSLGTLSNALVPRANSQNRSSSDFDVRHALSTGITYDIPFSGANSATRGLLSGWSIDSLIQARSALPVNVFYDRVGSQSRRLLNLSTLVRPDLVPGQSLYLYGSQYPGGKAFNAAAFTSPPIVSGAPARQGNFSRNALRGFGAAQWDFSVHRDFPIREQLKLQFRAEMFNLLNHPNFGQPVSTLGSTTALNPQFGLSTQMLGRSLTGSLGGGAGAFNPLYQIGGPRSIQLALKLSF